ncbi:MAG: class B sortase [Defluviitaleaceae bacterium]|nr:class B sortase [Defluviitaleaceae bacterium]
MAKKKQTINKRKQRLIICLAILSTVCAAVCAFIVVPHIMDLSAIRREQASLPDFSPFHAYWLEANPDYVGWLQINGTNINFPVVRGDDNVRYLTTSFRGEENSFGAIFMDYRSSIGLPHVIIYGHQARTVTNDWLMFGSLHEFLDEQFLASHPTIHFITNNLLYEFKIFSARLTDIHDPAYQLNFNAPGSFIAFLERNDAPLDAEQIITLSTCVGTNNDRRMIVQGALQRVIPVNTEYDENGGWRIVHDNLLN